jgi:hypothetical protein
LPVTSPITTYISPFVSTVTTSYLIPVGRSSPVAVPDKTEKTISQLIAEYKSTRDEIVDRRVKLQDVLDHITQSEKENIDPQLSSAHKIVREKIMSDIKCIDSVMK